MMQTNITKIIGVDLTFSEAEMIDYIYWFSNRNCRNIEQSLFKPEQFRRGEELALSICTIFRSVVKE